MYLYAAYKRLVSDQKIQTYWNWRDVTKYPMSRMGGGKMVAKQVDP